MKVSYNWLQGFFTDTLPEPAKLADLLTMHSMEIDGVEKEGQDFIIDAKTTPNLNHFCLSHRGIAREIGVVVNLKTKSYSYDFKEIAASVSQKKPEVIIENSKLCRRYVSRVIEGVQVGESPTWLKERLMALGQRSINNIVDSTNFVMLELGQPTHVFDADKIGSEIVVKNAAAGQQITTLDKKEVSLDESVLLITDGEHPLALAGIKGGNFAELDANTKNIVLESANFNPTLIRKTAQRIKIQTDASKRFENDLTPELAGEAMDVLTKLILEIAGSTDTKIGEIVDIYPRRANPFKLGISAKEASDIIGVQISDSDIEKIFDRFGFEYKKVKPIDEVLKTAPTFVGTPYKNGASISYDAPKLFDCSGFIGYLFAQAGVQIPRMSIDQYVWTKRIEQKDLQAGDIVFSNTGDLKRKIDLESIEFLPHTKVPAGVDHCGIFLGDGKIIHCSESKGGVVIEELAQADKFKSITGYGRVSDNTERFVITVPAERLDLRIKEDLAEEIGRIYGYDKIPNIDLPKIAGVIEINKVTAYKEKIRHILYAEGFSEVINYTFTDTGDVELANPMSPEKKFLRTNLVDGMSDCLIFNSRYSELVEMPQIKVFEFGHIFTKESESEYFILGIKNPEGLKKPKEKETLDTVVAKLSAELGTPLVKINTEENILEIDFNFLLEKLPELPAYDFSLLGKKDVKYSKISAYPFMIRDIAVFTPEGTKSEDVLAIIQNEAGELMIKNRLFDVFTKAFPDGSKKTSYAYRIIFQSYERTLLDEEINVIMNRITEKMNAQTGWQVR